MKKYNVFKNIGLFVVAIVISTGCESSNVEDSLVEDGNWKKVSSFEGVARSGAVSFVVDNKVFVGLGYDGDDYLSDFWSYDPDENFWEKISDFPGDPRTYAVAFSIANDGYVGTGYNGQDKLNDFWKYNISTNEWSQLEDFGGSARLGAIGFSANNSGYIGTGFDGNYLKDMWQFDPENGDWEQIISVKGEKREYASVFIIEDDNVPYVLTGQNNGINVEDIWEFDPIGIDWYSKNDLDIDDDFEIMRYDAVAFSIGAKGYIATGTSTSTWEFDPISDDWIEKTAFEGTSRQGATAFSINGRAFVGLGRNGTERYDDIWEFVPSETYDEGD